MALYQPHGPKSPTALHGLEDEVDAEAVVALHGAQVGTDVVLHADALVVPADLDGLVAGEALHPVDIGVGSGAEHFFGNGLDSEHLLQPVDHLTGPLQAHQVAAQDNAVETVVYKDQPGSKELGEQFHRPPPDDFVFEQQNHRRSGRWDQPSTAGSYPKGRKGHRGKKP